MLQTETRAGDYEILDVVQSSRKEVVYRVKNLAANRLEAMKVLPEALERDNEARERFFREIKMLARLIHPNIVSFYHATELNGKVVMTMELIEGVTLAERLESGPVPIGEAVLIMRQVLAALGHAHTHNVMHREVTPDNIWLVDGSVVKLGGFGLAKPKGDMNLTREGTSLGSVHYMAPEQVKGIGTLDHRADLYAAGCVLYELLTGKKPFEAKSQFDVMLAHVQKEPLPVGVANPNLPPALQHVVAQAMAKEPDQRYPNAWTMASALELAMDVRAAHPVPLKDLPKAPEPVHAGIALNVKQSTVSSENMIIYLVLATLLATVMWVVFFVLK